MKSCYKLIIILIMASFCPDFGLTQANQKNKEINHIKFVKQIEFLKSPKKSLKTTLFGAKEIKSVIPGSICQVNKELLAVTDAVNGNVIIVNKEGGIYKKISRFKSRRLVSPVCCCLDDQGNLYISDSALNLVLQFNQKFKFQKIFLAPSGSRITGIIFLKNLFYCVDTPNHRILCFNRQGKFQFTFGQRGIGEGQFNFPTHIKGNNDFIFVTDALNFRIQIFNLKGSFIRTFGKNGNSGGYFSKPKGLAIDRSENIFVADAMFDNVQVFNTRGDFLYYFGGPGHTDGQFWMPVDILIDQGDLIWVADSYNSRLQVFKMIKGLPE